MNSKTAVAVAKARIFVQATLEITLVSISVPTMRAVRQVRATRPKRLFDDMREHLLQKSGINQDAE
jgi:hypothetical protein